MKQRIELGLHGGSSEMMNHRKGVGMEGNRMILR